MTHQDAVRIARGGEGAIVATLLRLDGQLRTANEHNAYLHLQVDEICRLQVEKFALETQPKIILKELPSCENCANRPCSKIGVKGSEGCPDYKSNAEAHGRAGRADQGAASGERDRETMHHWAVLTGRIVRGVLEQG